MRKKVKNWESALVKMLVVVHKSDSTYLFVCVQLRNGCTVAWTATCSCSTLPGLPIQWCSLLSQQDSLRSWHLRLWVRHNIYAQIYVSLLLIHGHFSAFELMRLSEVHTKGSKDMCRESPQDIHKKCLWWDVHTQNYEYQSLTSHPFAFHLFIFTPFSVQLMAFFHLAFSLHSITPPGISFSLFFSRFRYSWDENDT